MPNYRYPTETPILVVTLVGLTALLVLTSIPTLCLAPLLVVLVVILTYNGTQAAHRQVMQVGMHVTPQSAPNLAAIVETCRQRLGAPPVEVYVLNNRERNAYTFGLSHPNVIVLHAPLIKIMDADELTFVVGHEMGHVIFNHAWLNTLIGGMAGVPLPIGAAIPLVLAFRSWSRACEFTCDRAGLIACGSLDKAIHALVEIVAGDVNTAGEIQQVLTVIDQQDERAGSVFSEFLSTHPLVAKRIQQLKEFASSAR